MDVIGKVYVDYILKDFHLDGKSYSIDNYKFGGCCNLFDNEFLNEILNRSKNFNYFLICDKKIHDNLKETFNNIDINYLIIDNQMPLAFIFEEHFKRTSFVIEDNLVNIENFSTQSDAACIFYGDKIYSNLFKFYKKLFIDTAGNNTNDLNTFLKSDFIRRNSVISISSEYVYYDQLSQFLNFKKATLILHNPKETIILTNKRKIIIPNKFYIENIPKNKNITGLGDKYFLLLSFYNHCLKLDLRRSVIKAQETIAKYLVDYLIKE